MTPERLNELSKVFRKRIQDLMMTCSEEIKTDSVDGMIVLIAQMAHAIGENVSILTSVGIPTELLGLVVNDGILQGYTAHKDFLAKREKQEKENPVNANKN